MTTRRLPAPLLDAVLVGASMLDVWAHAGDHEPLRLACALAAASSLLLRHRWPLFTFLVTLVAVQLADAIIAALVALYTLAASTRQRVLLGFCALALTISDVTSWPSPAFDLSDPSAFVTLGYTAATAAAPVFLGQLAQTRRELSLRLAEISEAREHEQILIAQNALAKERAQLAREMHDVVSHQVSLIAVRAGTLQVDAQDPGVREAAAAIRGLSTQTLDELRQMVNVLRGSEGRPMELSPQPSLVDLQRLVDNSGIEVELHTNLRSGPSIDPGTDAASGLQPDQTTGRFDSLPPPVQRAVYRTVQEALTNVRKHASGATATVRIHREGATVHVTVTNTAPTRPALSLPSAHYGLLGLRQRAELLGGTVTSGPTAAGGYELRLELPVERDHPQSDSAP
ncbi:sensor histidine kinase [Streptomyces formicae]|uniref:histidine kinase n=1 Tax=Streptomyces formicae TaxID=1616117 RepID=A0ABY3WKV6_9ACTN|nr:histidine kinase [Streptomyces formicae]UNM12236.1 two-component sensor histidine kinase [Streptomyces formicae]